MLMNKWAFDFARVQLLPWRSPGVDSKAPAASIAKPDHLLPDDLPTCKIFDGVAIN
jgi:hypothetical protein